ncbi:MAG: DUF4825 domain-containing protein [Lachnospiraceae bacterium]|nr:DUF4825 domain-containing protein [Lachnospiraceae bacterium]
MKEAIITSSVLILCIVLLRKLCGRRISAKLQYTLWLIVAVRLVMPGITMLIPNLLPESHYSVLNVTAQVERAAQNYMKPPEQLVQGSLPSEGLPFLTEERADGKVVTYLLEQTIWPELMEKIWHLGMIVSGGWMAAVNIRFKKKLYETRRRVEREDFGLPVYMAKELPSPCLYGLPGKEAVYLPENVTEDEDKIRHILAHEYCHYKQKDIWWSALRCTLLAVYWFHPLVWLAAVLSKRDCELACDEAAIGLLGEEERIAYGKTLVSLVTRKTKAVDIVCTVTTMTEDPKDLKERIRRIAKSPHKLAFILIPVFTAVAAVIVLTFTRADSVPEGAYPLEEDSLTVTTSCFQISFPETFAGAAYYRSENGTDIIVYHRDSGLEIGRFCKLYYETAARLTFVEGKEAVFFGNYDADLPPNSYLDTGRETVGITDHYYESGKVSDEDGAENAGVPGTDSNGEIVDYLPEAEEADNTAALEASGGLEAIPAPELVSGDMINLPFQENEDYNEPIMLDDTESLKEDEIAEEDEIHNYNLPAEETAVSEVYLPPEEISVSQIYLPAEQSCYLYIPADYSEADPKVRKELSWMNQSLIELADSVIVLYMSREAVEEILSTLVENRTAYVGDNVRVSKIAGCLPAAPGLSYQYLELETTLEPYEATLHYRIQEDHAFQADSDIPFLEAVLMFSAVENLEICNIRIYDIRKSDEETHPDPAETQYEVISFSRSEMETLFGPLYSCSETKETITALYNNVLEYLGEDDFLIQN